MAVDENWMTALLTYEAADQSVPLAVRMLVLFCLLGSAWICSAQQQAGRTVRISVLSLFHPTTLRLQAAPGAALQVSMNGASHTLTGGESASIVREDSGQLCFQTSSHQEGNDLQGTSVVAVPRALVATDEPPMFSIEVPGKLRRSYAGTLEIRVHDRQLEAIVTMPLETAVASIVQAESTPGAGMEALKAQAVAARSFLVAHRAGHTGFDFCDTTHCQFLRSPPARLSLAAKAAAATEGLVLAYRDEGSGQEATLAAMYARSCGGHTRTLREIGVRRLEGYPYYAVRCVYCSRHPEAWKRPPGTASIHSEQDRLAWNRIHGWSALPSIGATRKNGSAEGVGVGHGIGLCQLGAADMARHGAGFAEILAHYYPNTRLKPIALSSLNTAQ
jgi:stage II sporulation protein D